MSPPPVVTGLSPIEGLPGTKITIRGEHLGRTPNDLIGLTICGCDCLLSAEWKSPNKVIARSGPGKGKGDVIITTRSGGVGTSTVQFRGYHQKIGPLAESAVWVEEVVMDRRSLSPSSYQQDDPLGLSVEGNEKKFPEDDLNEFFPGSCGDISSESFSPGWFLLENHHTTTFNDLKAGLSFLRRKVESQKEGQLSFLKANVGSVMDQIDTLVSLKDRFENDVLEHTPEPTLKLERAIKESVHEANKLFDEVLARRDRADATRSALSVLTRYRFLFCLPCAIETNIKRGDYDMVINDYARVKNLFGKTEVPVFKKALVEIEKQVLKLRESLYEKLKQMPSTVEEQKKLIRYIVNLEVKGDPAWDAITSHYEYLLSRIKKCYEEQKEDYAAEELSKPKNVHSSSKYSKFTIMQEVQPIIPQWVLFVEELCEIMSLCFPDLWKLGQAYFTGELHIKVESGRQAGFKHIVLTSMDTFCKTLRRAILPHTVDKSPENDGDWLPKETEVVSAWLPHCLRYVRSTYSIFIRLDLPSEALDVISVLITDLRLHCMNVLFKQAMDQVKSLGKKETWKIEFVENHSGITDLPLKFHQIVQEVVQVVRESVLISEQRESPLLESMAAQNEFNKQVQSLLLVFCSTLENLAFKNKNNGDDDHSQYISQLIGSPAAHRGSDKGDATPVWEQRLLTTLSNCQYTSKVVLPKIIKLFAKNGYPIPKVPIETAKSNLNSLDKSILEAYLEQKCDPLVGTIEPSMYLGKFDWDTSVKPTDLKPYAKECINNLIGVHTEVISISPALVQCVLSQVVETVAEELSRLMLCVKKFSPEGNIQARTDILALRETFSNFITSKADHFFNEALEAIPPLEKSDDEKLIKALLKKFHTRMRLQVLCFSGGPVSVVDGVNDTNNFSG